MSEVIFSAIMVMTVAILSALAGAWIYALLSDKLPR